MDDGDRALDSEAIAMGIRQHVPSERADLRAFIQKTLSVMQPGHRPPGGGRPGARWPG
jgi:hypothetical protein